MKRIGRLIFDLIGGGIAVIAIIFAIFAITGETAKGLLDANGSAANGIVDNFSTDANTAQYLAYGALGLGGLALLLTTVSIFMIFKSDSHIGLTVAIWIIAIVAVGVAIGGFALNHSAKESIKIAITGKI